MVDAAADAVVIVVLVLFSRGGHRFDSDGHNAAAYAAVIVVLVLSCSEHWHDGECIAST